MKNFLFWILYKTMEIVCFSVSVRQYNIALYILVVYFDTCVTRLRLSQQVSFEGYFLQVSHILAAVFPQVADKPYIGANCITLYVFSSAMINRGD